MYTPVNLDKVRNFRYGMKAISLIEKKFKKPMNKVDFDSLTMEDTATIVWAGLVHEDKNLTPDKVMDLIDENGNLQEVMKAMNDAMSAAFSGGSSEDEKNK